MRRTSAVLAAVILGVAGLSGCGDDKEGPAEDAGKAIDEAGREGGQELKEGSKELDREIDDDGKKDD